MVRRAVIPIPPSPADDAIVTAQTSKQSSETVLFELCFFKVSVLVRVMNMIFL